MYKIYFHITDALEIYSNNLDKFELVPDTDKGITEDIHSPALPFFKNAIDLNSALIKNPSSTYFCKVKDDSMADEGICAGDTMIIDKSLPREDGKLALCFMDGHYSVKRISIDKGSVSWLMPTNESFEPIKVNHKNKSIIWGIIVYVIKSF